MGIGHPADAGGARSPVARRYVQVQANQIVSTFQVSPTTMRNLS